MNNMINTLLTKSIINNQRISISEDGKDKSYSKYAGELTRDEINSLSEWDNVYMYTEQDTNTIFLLFSNNS